MYSAPVSLPKDPACGPSIATPDFNHGAFTVSCSTIISAPPLICLGIVLDATKYPEWNTFCPKVIIDSVPAPADSRWNASDELKHLVTQPGALFPGVDFQFQVAMVAGEQPSNNTSLHVSRLESLEVGDRKGYRVAWTMRGWLYYMLRAERVQEFIATENGLATEYYCYETFGGVVAYPMRYVVGGQVADGFKRWMTSLKERAEKEVR